MRDGGVLIADGDAISVLVTSTPLCHPERATSIGFKT
jgi:hypothetical protein